MSVHVAVMKVRLIAVARYHTSDCDPTDSSNHSSEVVAIFLSSW